jgi:segregation and condensation protein A
VEREVRFSSLFDAETLRSKIVGMFLAVLELIRHHAFRASQPDLYGEITIYPPADDPQPGTPPSASASIGEEKER